MAGSVEGTVARVGVNRHNRGMQRGGGNGGAPGARAQVSRAVRGWCAVGGGVLVALGCVAVFVSDNGAGTAAVLAAGAALVLVAVLAERITAVEAGGVKVELGQAVARKLDEAARADEDGDHVRAAELRDEARELIELNSAEAARFAVTRRSSPGWRRSVEQELQVRSWAEAAHRTHPTRELLEQVYDEGSEANRVMALAMMSGHPPAASHEVAERAITEPVSAFEQYHGLVVAHLLALHEPASPATRHLREVVAGALDSGSLGHAGTDRVALARRVLELVPADH